MKLLQLLLMALSVGAAATSVTMFLTQRQIVEPNNSAPNLPAHRDKRRLCCTIHSQWAVRSVWNLVVPAQYVHRNMAIASDEKTAFVGSGVEFWFATAIDLLTGRSKFDVVEIAMPSPSIPRNEGCRQTSAVLLILDANGKVTSPNCSTST